MRKISILSIAALVLCCLSVAIPVHAAKAIWTAPAGETVRQLRTGKSPGMIVVLTESAGRTKWWIREVRSDGDANLLASGTEKLCSICPISSISYQGDHLVICVKNPRDSKLDWKKSAADIVRQADRHEGNNSATYYLMNCDLSKNRAVPIMPGAPTISGTTNAGRFILGIHRAYSHDGRFISFRGEDRSKSLGGRRVEGIWLYDSLKKTTKFIWSEHGWCDAGWDDRGLMYLFDRGTGSLYRGPGEPLKLYKVLHPGIFGDVAPNGSMAVVVDQKGAVWTIHVSDLAGDKADKEFKALNSSPAVDIEWSRDAKQALLIGAGGHSTPVLIGAGPTAVELKNVGKIWKAEAGAAFIDKGSIAVVDSSRRRIVRCQTR